MKLNDLPLEILMMISDQLEYTWDLSALCLVNKRFYGFVRRFLDRFDRQYNRESTLRWAVSCPTETVVRISLVSRLLEALVKKNSNGLTEYSWGILLSKAAEYGHLIIAELVLDARKGLDGSNNRNRALQAPGFLEAPLSIAALNGCIELVRLLKQHGAVLFSSNKLKFAFNDHDCLVKMALDCIHDSGSMHPDDLGIVLHRVLDNKQNISDSHVVDFFQRLFEWGANVNTPSPGGSETNMDNLGLVGFATIRGLIETVRWLLEHGAEACPLLADGTRLRPLQYVITERDRQVIGRLILDRIDIPETIADGREAHLLLRAAAVCGSNYILGNLLRNFWPKLSADARKKALDDASRHGHEEAVRIILSHGVQPNSETLYAALKSRSLSLTQSVLDHNAGIDPTTYTDIAKSQPQSTLYLATDHHLLFKLLLEKGASFGPATVHNRLLHEVVAAGNIPNLQLLLDQGVPLTLNGESRLGSNILNSAARGGVAMLESLFSHSFRYPRQNVQGHKSAVEVAASL